MTLTNFMPRYGTREHQRLGLLLFALFVAAVLMIAPSMAHAAFEGLAVPDTKLQSNVDTSFRAWWRFFAVPGLWISVIWLVICVACFGSKGWQVPLVIGAVFLFGEMFVDGVKKTMG
ncbi:hypothetical protein ACI77O_11970 [Pseudomonas tritici]|uniref:hypothetical protein n=1 Tax=Pseudomonas tritici TaxID=2745518 RepID=UPI00387B76DC